MTLKSMTGFARCDGQHGDWSWTWEARSVNGRGLDVRLRVPNGFNELEPALRELCKQKLGRGNCSFTLNIQREAGVTQVRLNEELFNQLVAASRRAAELVETDPPSLDSLLTMKGVLDVEESEETPEDVEARMKAVSEGFEALLDQLNNSRQNEGHQLELAIIEQIEDIDKLVVEIENSPDRAAETVRAKLEEQLARLNGSAELDKDRLYQEAVLIAAKADIEEELTRLKSHVVAAKELLESKEPVGRQLDFLTQEFNREANTICSKSSGTGITRSGLAMKTSIDRMREQVQNIE